MYEPLVDTADYEGYVEGMILWVVVADQNFTNVGISSIKQTGVGSVNYASIGFKIGKQHFFDDEWCRLVEKNWVGQAR